MNLIEELRRSEVIPAVKEESQLQRAVKSNASVVFLLKSDLSSAKEMVDYCHSHGKKAFLHFDLTEGLSNDEAAVKYAAEIIKPDGIISTKNNVIKVAKQCGMFCVFRVFLIDSHSVEVSLSNTIKNKADAVEILPGIIPDLVKTFREEADAQVITGGLINCRRHIDEAINAGAICCSTSDEELWNF